jgi:ribosomal protein S8
MKTKIILSVLFLILFQVSALCQQVSALCQLTNTDYQNAKNEINKAMSGSSNKSNDYSTPSKKSDYSAPSKNSDYSAPSKKSDYCSPNSYSYSSSSSSSSSNSSSNYSSSSSSSNNSSSSSSRDQDRDNYRDRNNNNSSSNRSSNGSSSSSSSSNRSNNYIQQPKPITYLDVNGRAYTSTSARDAANVEIEKTRIFNQNVNNNVNYLNSGKTVNIPIRSLVNEKVIIRNETYNNVNSFNDDRPIVYDDRPIVYAANDMLINKIDADRATNDILTNKIDADRPIVYATSDIFISINGKEDKPVDAILDNTNNILNIISDGISTVDLTTEFNLEKIKLKYGQYYYDLTSKIKANGITAESSANITYLLNTLKNATSQTRTVVNSSVSKQVAKDIKEIFSDNKYIQAFANVERHGKTLNGAGIVIDGAKAGLFKDKKDFVNDIKAAGKNFVKSLPEKGSAVYNTVNSGIAHLNIYNDIKEFSIRTVDNIKNIINDGVEAIFNNKESSFGRQHNKTMNYMRNDANNTTKKTLKNYLNNK